MNLTTFETCEKINLTIRSRFRRRVVFRYKFRFPGSEFGADLSSDMGKHTPEFIFGIYTKFGVYMVFRGPLFPCVELRFDF